MSMEEEETDDLELRDKLFDATLRDYQRQTSELSEVDRTRSSIDEVVRSQACLVCLDPVAHRDAIWSCHGCYTIYHLTCIQRWVKEGVHQAQLTQLLTGNEANRGNRADWCCPKCRKEYQQNYCPTRYFCFCGKVVDPPKDPWLVPHSCGQVCKAKLGCTHECLLLCHPGPHPNCPVTVRSKCGCGKSDLQARRCGNQQWTCGKICGKKLRCGHHSCPLKCHLDECPPCTEQSVRSCACGKQRGKRLCAEPEWHCTQVCGKVLVCGKHSCEQKCHQGKCSPCVESSFTCPCGKTPVEGVLCTDDVKCCGDTCGKLLDCQLHRCFERCHKGECPPCDQLITKRCRCLMKERSVTCGQEFLCDLKCKRKRNCGRHNCSRRCCDGNCPPCEQICGRTLSCGTHKCSSPCHSGLCYPCPLLATVTCFCGSTAVSVPCGREKKTRPPRCFRPCAIPPDCHHPVRLKHPCHFGRCPPCSQVCQKMFDRCQHSCPAICHSAVLLDVNLLNNKRPTGPWEKLEPKWELVNLPCPPCRMPVPIKCLGGHEVSQLPCFEAKSYSCGRACGTPIPCGNHICQKPCHNVDPANDPCEECNGSCELPRPRDCSHNCLKPCHPAPCPPCRQMIRHLCHCGLAQKFIPCWQWSEATDSDKRKFLSCENKCPKLMSCGHRCLNICHPAGECSDATMCRKRINVFCSCKLLKEQLMCNSGVTVLPCGPVCAEEKRKKVAEAEAEQAKEQKRLEEEKTARQAQQEAIELRGGKRKRKQKAEGKEDTRGTNLKSKLLAVTLGIVVVAVIVYYRFFG